MDAKMFGDYIDQIPVDSDYADASDSSGDECNSIMAVASTVDSYRYENGRRYHAFRDGQYWGPNDEINAAYEKVLHHLFLRSMNDRLHFAPLESPKRIADLGTGTGLWAMDIADQYEDAEILGVDLSPIPQSSQPNVRWELDDITSEWTHTEHFDFIHLRCLYGAVEDWPQLYRQCIDHLEPNGYIEHVELSIIPHTADGSPLPADSILHRWVGLAHEFYKSSHRTLFVAESIKADMESAGLVDVTEHKVVFPVGAWSSDEELKITGKWYKQAWFAGMEGWIMAMCTRCLNWTPEEVRIFVKDTKRYFEDRSTHLYYYGFIVHGRKP